LTAGFCHKRVIYKRADRWQPVTELIPIAITPAALGGYRHWFLCPGCKRRCRILHRADRFRCRLCLGAKYESQYESEPMRICARRWRIRKWLEDRGGAPWPFGLDEGFPPKPPRMHWKTYRRLQALDEDLEDRWRIGIQAWLDRSDPRHLEAAVVERLLQ
jgi:hypothetical protein